MYVTNFTNAVVRAPDGSQVYPSTEDANGNYFSTDANGDVVDTLGRTPVTKAVNGSQTTYTVVNSQGTQSVFTVTTTSIGVATAFGVSGVTEYSGSLTVIQSVTLPDGRTYSFGYDSYGELNSVTLPTGGTVAYGFSNYTDPLGGVNRWVASHTSA
jgi:YD repeat-containing protein